jgi:hypothetical protein
LQLLQSNGGIPGILANSASVVAALGGNSISSLTLSDIARGLSEATDNLTNFVGGIGQVGSSTPGSLDANAVANSLAGAMTALGNAVGLNPQAVSDINKAVKVAGSVLSGALNGASFGPIGAVVGGLVGLLGGLFGGGGGEDPTLQAIGQLDAKLSQLGQTMIAGFNEVSSQLAQVSAQIQKDFQDLSFQVQSGFHEMSQQILGLQQIMTADFDEVEKLIVALANQEIQDKHDQFRNRASVFEEAYREARLANTQPSQQLEAELKVSLLGFLSSLQTSGVGFSGPAFVGSKSLEQELDTVSGQLGFTTGVGGQPPSANFLTPFLGYTDHFLGNPAVFTSASFTLPSPVKPGSLADVGAKVHWLLRTNRYAAAADNPGALTVNGVQQICLSFLMGFDSSPEKVATPADYQQIIFSSTQQARVPLAPVDLWSVLENVRSIVGNLTPIGTAASMIGSTLDMVKPALLPHYLLTSQNTLPALLFVRRKLTQRLIDDIVSTFWNPFMAAVDVFRRAVNTASSRGAQFGPSHSHILVNDIATATGMVSHFDKKALPLSDASSITFDASKFAEISFVLNDLSLFFSNLPSGPGLALFLAQVGRFEIESFAARLPSAIRRVDGRSLSDYLSAIRTNWLVLNVLDRCIGIRLESLRASGIALPNFDAWSNGLEEYAIVASFALAQPLVTTEGVDQDF